MRARVLPVLFAAALVPVVHSQPATKQAKAGQASAKSSYPMAEEWPNYNHDIGGTRYSPLSQINTTNVSRLTEAWTYRPAGGASATPAAVPAAAPSEPDAAGPPAEGRGRGGRGGFGGRGGRGRGGPPGVGASVTPIVANGLMYVPAGNIVVALDPDNGKEVWRYQLASGTASTRGVAFWRGDKQNPPRILFTSGKNLVGLNATTGKLDPGFGKEGTVDMGVAYGGVPTIFGDIVSVGAASGERETGSPGNTRAFDAKTGSKLWEFDTVAQPGQPGHETWLNDGWKDRSGTNIWGFAMSGDVPRGLLYMPIDGPASNYYGGDRPGADAYGNSVVAVDAKTGKFKWYFQTVHHDLWDYDNPPAPVLLDITQKGKKIPVLVQIGKTGWMYILNRVTGKPVFGVEEKPVEKGDVPGEWYSPTQPFPVKPAALDRNDYKPSDMVTAADTNETHVKNCEALVERSGGFYNAGPFTPFNFHADGTPPKSTIIFPGATGGTNWGGPATDPNLGYVFVYTQNQGQVGWTEKRKPGLQYAAAEAGTKLEYGRASVDGAGPGHTFVADAGMGVDGKPLGQLPCQRPPWGTLNAVNANTGDIVWQVPLGKTPGLGPDKENTGRAGGFAGPTATAGGLVFIASVNDAYFRAFDEKTGKRLWESKLNAPGAADPVSYQGKNGKQYVAVTAGGQLNVFALP